MTPVTEKIKVSVSETHKAALRAFLGDMERFVDEYADELEKDSNPLGFSMLMSFSNGTMLRRHFGPECTGADVVRYVARLRAGDEDARALDARMIENTIRTHLDDASLTAPPPYGGRMEDVLESLFTVLLSLVEEHRLDEKGIADLVDEAAAGAEAHELDLSALPVPIPPEVMEELRRHL